MNSTKYFASIFFVTFALLALPFFSYEAFGGDVSQEINFEPKVLSNLPLEVWAMPDNEIEITKDAEIDVCSNGKYLVNNRGGFQSNPGEVKEGDTILFAAKTSTEHDSTTNATLTIGDVSETLELRTTTGECELEGVTIDYGETHKFYKSRQSFDCESNSRVRRCLISGNFQGNDAYRYSDCEETDSPPDDYVAFGKQAYLKPIMEGPICIKGSKGVPNLESVPCIEFSSHRDRTSDLRYVSGSSSISNDFEIWIQQNVRRGMWGYEHNQIDRKVAVLIPPQATRVTLFMHTRYGVEDPGMDVMAFRYGQPPDPDFTIDDTDGVILDGRDFRDCPMTCPAWGWRTKDSSESIYFGKSPLEVFMERDSIAHYNVLAGSYNRNRILLNTRSRHLDESFEDKLGDFLYIDINKVPGEGRGRMWYYKLSVMIDRDLEDEFLEWLGEYDPDAFDPDKGEII